MTVMRVAYFLIMAGAIILPLCCVGIFSKFRKEPAFFDQSSTQTIKGIAICLVVVCHFMGKFGGGVTLFTPLGGIGVMIFLMLAAYGINESWNVKGDTSWWRKRIIAVFIPYAFVRLILYWINCDFSLLDMLLDILLIKPRYVYGWYLNYLLVWYTVFYVTMKIPVLKKT